MNGILGMNYRRLSWICFGLAGAALLSGCSSIVKDSYEIYPGQNLVGTLRVEGGGSRLKVSTNMQVAPPGYVFTGTGGAIKIDNRYSREEVEGTGSIGIWKLNTEYLTEPTELSIVVEGASFSPTVVLFVGATEEEVLDGDKEGYVLPLHLDFGGYPPNSMLGKLAAKHAALLATKVTGNFIFQPKTLYYLTVRSRSEPVKSDYQVALKSVKK